MKTDELYRGMLEKLTWQHQYTVAIEELSELIKELTKAIRGKVAYAHICEEIADVEIVLEQIKLTIPRSKLQIATFKRFKRERLRVLYLEGVER